LAAFGVFAVGYLMRPVGSLLIALLPTHSQWGAGAGLALLGLLMVQGFSVGGEFTGSMTYATEAAPPGQQGLLVLRIIALVSFANVVFYVLFVYLVDYSVHQPGSSLAQANTTSTVIQTLGLPLVLLGGVLADRWGKLQVNRLGTLLLDLVTPIALPVVQLAGPSGLVMGQLLGVLPVMMSMGGQGVLAVEWVPVRQRCTVFSIA
jgi:MFS family permease